MTAIDYNLVVNDVGWDKSYRLPAINKENAELEEQVLRTQKELESLTSFLKGEEKHDKTVEDHLKHIENELQTTQQLIQARDAEIKAEEHMEKLIEREYGWLAQDIQNLNKQTADLEEKCDRKSVVIKRLQEQVCKSCEEMHVAQESMDAWLEEISNIEDDSLAIGLYRKQDENKIKELLLQFKNCSELVEKEKTRLDELTTEAMCTQVELDQLAKEFKAGHEERKKLIRQWELAVKQMKKQDKEIDNLISDMTNTQSEIKTAQTVVDEKNRFYQQLLGNNNELESELYTTDKTLLKQRTAMQKIETDCNDQNNELIALNLNINNLNSDVLKSDEEMNQLRRDIQDINNRCLQQKNLLEKLKETLHKLESNLLTGEEKLQLSDNLFDDEKFYKKHMEDEIEHLMDLKYKKTQELNIALDKKKTINAEITSCHNAILTWKKTIQSLEKHAQKQEELIYGQDIIIQQLKTRIGFLTGSLRMEEKKLVQQKLAQLNEVLEKKGSAVHYLNDQIKILHDDIRLVQQVLEKQEALKADLISKLEELQLHTEIAEQHLKILIQQKQNIMVDENLLKLKVKKVQDDLSSKADEIFSAEKRKFELEMTIKERRQDISIQRDMLKGQLKLLEEERQQINKEFFTHSSKIEQLKNRYEILVAGMNLEDCDENGEPCHIKYFIKAVQEKQVLQLEGNELDAKVLNAEKEVLALENTLRLMHSRNEQFRHSFNPVTKTSEDFEENKLLDEQLHVTIEKHKFRKQQMNELISDCEQMMATMDDLDKQENYLNWLSKEKQDHLSNLGHLLQEQFLKIDRASTQNHKHRFKLQKKSKTDDVKFEEDDINLRLLRETNKTLVKNLVKVISQYPDIRSEVHKLFIEAKLQPPMVQEKWNAGDSVSTWSTGSIESASPFCTTSPRSRVEAFTPGSISSVQLGHDPISRSSSRLKQCSATSLSKKSSVASVESLGIAKRSKEKTSGMKCRSETEMNLALQEAEDEMMLSIFGSKVQSKPSTPSSTDGRGLQRTRSISGSRKPPYLS